MRSGWLVGLLLVVVVALFATMAILLTNAVQGIWGRAPGAEPVLATARAVAWH